MCQTTTLSISSLIDLKYIEKFVNESVPKNTTKTLKDAINVKTLGLKTKIKFEITTNAALYSPIRFESSTKGLIASIPLDLKVRVKSSSLADSRTTVRASVMVKVFTSIAINSDWTHSFDYRLDYQWESKPEVKLFRKVKLRLTQRLEPEIDKHIKGLEPIIAKLIDSLDIKSKVGRVWELAHQPKLINEAPNAWLTCTPKSISFSGFEYLQNSIKVNVALQGDVLVVLQEMAPKSTMPFALPSLQTQTS
ncbi:DUF4403 family protein [Vibrio breoganii]|uniref:DUF4403 family protein n=1 Tax=Vibrio breoganii TaxID=553239 RepID=UPI0021C2883D|nr:DUF4403 family protein [Vibrio breoganii]MDN3717773.1 DUF4403 family protein [Vibrio breoganii]